MSVDSSFSLLRILLSVSFSLVAWLSDYTLCTFKCFPLYQGHVSWHQAPQHSGPVVALTLRTTHSWVITESLSHILFHNRVVLIWMYVHLPCHLMRCTFAVIIKGTKTQSWHHTCSYSLICFFQIMQQHRGGPNMWEPGACMLTITVPRLVSSIGSTFRHQSSHFASMCHHCMTSRMLIRLSFIISAYFRTSFQFQRPEQCAAFPFFCHGYLSGDCIQ